MSSKFGQISKIQVKSMSYALCTVEKKGHKDACNISPKCYILYPKCMEWYVLSHVAGVQRHIQQHTQS